MLTITEVKQILPPVRGRWQSKVWSCMVTGRFNEFATVSPHSITEGTRIRSIIGPCYQVAWETVARCFNEGRPVLLELEKSTSPETDPFVEYATGSKSPAALQALALIHIRSDGPVSFNSIHRFIRTQGQLPELCPSIAITTALNVLLHERRIEIYNQVWNDETRQNEITFRLCTQPANR